MANYKVRVGDDGRVHYHGAHLAVARSVAASLSNVRLGRAKVADTTTRETEVWEWGTRVRGDLGTPVCTCRPYHVINCPAYGSDNTEED